MNYKEKERLARLEERLKWLEKRYLESNKDLFLDKAEASALRWAIEYIKSADRELNGFSLLDVERTLDPTTLYERAVALVVDRQRATPSLLKRKLFITGQKARMLLTEMESKGVVGPDRGEEPRQVLIKEVA